MRHFFKEVAHTPHRPNPFCLQKLALRNRRWCATCARASGCRTFPSGGIHCHSLTLRLHVSFVGERECGTRKG